MEVSIIDFLHFDEPTSEQKEALIELESFSRLECGDDFFVLTGSAGTGKTSLVTALVGFLNSLEIDYRIVAPTGRAARIIGRKTNVLSSTIHSLIYDVHTDKKTGFVFFSLKSSSNSDPMMFIVDEASMVTASLKNSVNFKTPSSLLEDLVRFVKTANPNNKIFFIGDAYQLPPVGEQESFALNAEYLSNTFNFSGQAFELREVKRQEDGSYILTEATGLRNLMKEGGGAYDPGNIPSTGNIYSGAREYAYDLEREGPEYSVSIGVSNKQVRFFNDLVREKRYGNYAGSLEVGDLLLVLRNYNRNGEILNNGDQVIVEEIEWGKKEVVADLSFVPVSVRLLFSDDEAVIVHDLVLLDTLIRKNGSLAMEEEKNLIANRMAKNPNFRESQNPSDDKYVGCLRMSYGYALTAHKAQGGEWKKVFVNTYYLPSLKWTYTAITRAQEELKRF